MIAGRVLFRELLGGEVIYRGWHARLTLGMYKMNTEHEQVKQLLSENDGQAREPRKISRREALAIVGKHAVYTAPAVLAVLSVTKSNSAHAETSF